MTYQTVMHSYIAKKIVDDIHKDLQGRAGFDSLWDSLDSDVRAEIIEEHYKMTDDSVDEYLEESR